MPKHFEDYNKQIGGADLFDQFVSTYRVRFKSKKWWWPLFAWVVNASTTNAWILFRTVKKQNIGRLEFQREIVMTILASFGRNKLAKSQTFPRNVASNVKLDTKNHILVKDTSKNCSCKHCGAVVDQSIYARNAKLRYTLTVSRTTIHETQNLLYCFLPEVLIM